MENVMTNLNNRCQHQNAELIIHVALAAEVPTSQSDPVENSS